MKRLLLAMMLSLALLGMTPRPAEGGERPQVAAIRATVELRIDGILDEQDWGRAPPIRDFRLIEVREGEAPSESTDVRVLFDDTHVFFGIRCGNRGPGSIRASLAPRDGILDDDHIAVHLDTYRDLHRAYIFGVNPYGVQLDGILDGMEPDFNWDGVWQAETRREPTGWSAEIAVPLRTLRFPTRGPGVWGLWFRRQITKNDEVCTWPLWRQAEQGDIMLQAGDLTGVGGLRGGGLEVQPYAASTGSFHRNPTLGGDGVGAWHRDHELDAGLDLEYALTSTLLGNGTLNPDYSQIEADALQIDVNRRFPLFFPEKRPFFLEGAEIFTTPYRLVYTRRMADPAFGAKLVGTQGRWRLGAIAVRDDGGGSTEGIGARSDDAPARQGWFTIGRAAYDLGENNRLGVLVTDHVNESGTNVPAGEIARSGRNALLAADAHLRFARSLFFTGQVTGTRTRVDIEQTGGRERFSDYAYSGALWWADGVRYAKVYQDYLGPDFRAEAGFLERVDIRNTGYDANVIVRPENRWLRFWQPRSDGDVIRDHQGVLQERRIAGAIDWGFQKQTFLETRLAHVAERWLSRVYDRTQFIFELENTLWRPLAFTLAGTLEDGIFYASTDSASFLGWQETWELEATARPWPWLTSELTATRSRFARSRGGEQLYDLWLLGAKTTWQFTRRLYARLYPQYDTGADHLDLDALLGYVIHPGSVLYLGFNSDLDKLGPRHRATQGTVFFKASYLFQR